MPNVDKMIAQRQRLESRIQSQGGKSANPGLAARMQALDKGIKPMQSALQAGARPPAALPPRGFGAIDPGRIPPGFQQPPGLGGGLQIDPGRLPQGIGANMGLGMGPQGMNFSPEERQFGLQNALATFGPGGAPPDYLARRQQAGAGQTGVRPDFNAARQKLASIQTPTQYDRGAF
jgi:hypothetical protein